MKNRNRPRLFHRRRRRFKGVIDCSLLHWPDHFLFHFFPHGSLPLSVPLSLWCSVSLSLGLPLRLSSYSNDSPARSLSPSLSLFLLRQRDWFTGWQGRRCPGAAKQWLTTGRTFNEPLWRVSGVASSGGRMCRDPELSGVEYFLVREVLDWRDTTPLRRLFFPS